MSKKLHIIFHEQEIALMKEVLKFIRQAKYEMQGDEILAAAQILKWVESLPSRATEFEPPRPPEPQPVVEDAKRGKKKCQSL